MQLLSSLALAALAAGQNTLWTATKLRPAPRVPEHASKAVDPSFPSFAIQVSSFAAYTGNISHPNEFSHNLIRSVEERTGGPLAVRVGGTNGDYSNFNPAQKEAITPHQEGAGIGQKFVLGPVHFEGFRLWGDTRWVFCIPFANRNETNTLYQLRSALENIGEDRLEALEIGNEIDLYGKQGVRPKPYTPADGADDFKDYAKFLASEVDIPEGPIYEALTIASASSASGAWSAQEFFEAGAADDGNVKSVSLHHYEYTNTSVRLQETLMNHTFVKEGVDQYQSDLQYMSEEFPDIDVIFGESGRYSDSMSSLDNTEDIFGSALWTVDYLLYLMTLNVKRVNMQLGMVFGYVGFHPVFFEDITPEVRAPYYGHLLVSEFMGGCKDFRVSEIDVPGDDFLAAYGGYENGKLKRVALINFDAWDKSGPDSKRPKRSFELKVPHGVRHVKVQTLTSPAGARALSEFHWAGKTWTYETNGLGEKVKGVKEFQTVHVRHGVARLEVGASEAVLLHL